MNSTDIFLFVASQTVTIASRETGYATGTNGQNAENAENATDKKQKYLFVMNNNNITF